ncbi:uncharacterized protein BJ212DRAFT_1373022 [Suillus subaureus]|uniref:Uncharacterized protein n=1 Tax=Suillus subaureus TaxID=48587 RepID=A0A9P7JAZ3_9AGAM|nr:uncharacterized protein BJ212DRAFT_1373022 [Suillus subaureus]KAG1811773.1 hypothetical protein BJ212DRAFT_1373022 [Suillus subaureus]
MSSRHTCGRRNTRIRYTRSAWHTNGQEFVIKYLWSTAGYGLIAVPLLITGKRSLGVGAVDGEGKSDEKW